MDKLQNKLLCVAGSCVCTLKWVVRCFNLIRIIIIIISRKIGKCIFLFILHPPPFGLWFLLDNVVFCGRKKKIFLLILSFLLSRGVPWNLYYSKHYPIKSPHELIDLPIIPICNYMRYYFDYGYNVYLSSPEMKMDPYLVKCSSLIQTTPLGGFDFSCLPIV